MARQIPTVTAALTFTAADRAGWVARLACLLYTTLSIACSSLRSCLELLAPLGAPARVPGRHRHRWRLHSKCCRCIWLWLTGGWGGGALAGTSPASSTLAAWAGTAVRSHAYSIIALVVFARQVKVMRGLGTRCK
ncbi:hypothetical protein C8Q79DRAFT_260460 [Trametes meyenii]|nr:hypothetical protein C8Q79DRAFT_260460 [Trametes meyenii]